MRKFRYFPECVIPVLAVFLCHMNERMKMIVLYSMVIILISAELRDSYRTVIRIRLGEQWKGSILKEVMNHAFLTASVITCTDIMICFLTHGIMKCWILILFCYICFTYCLLVVNCIFPKNSTAGVTLLIGSAGLSIMSRNLMTISFPFDSYMMVSVKYLMMNLSVYLCMAAVLTWIFLKRGFE